MGQPPSSLSIFLSIHNSLDVTKRKISLGVALIKIMVGVAQLVELRIVDPAVAGSSPVAHP